VLKNLTLRIGNQPPSSIARALIITRRELRDSMRDWRILSPLISLTFIVPSLVVLAIRFGKTMLDKLEPGSFEDRVLPFATLSVGFFPMSFSLIIAFESFVGEKERNSLEALLSAPLTDLELFMGKFLAAVIPTILSSAYGTLVFVIGILLTGGPMPTDPLNLIFFILLGTAEALVMVTGAVIVSSHSTSVRGANLLASFVILPMTIIVQIEALLVISGQSNMLFFVLLSLLLIFVILLRTGVRVFNREEILSREGGDSLKIKAIFSNFFYIFARTPEETIYNRKSNLRKFSLWRLYRYDIPQIIKLNGPAIIMVVVSLVIAIFIGWWVTTLQPIKELLAQYQGSIKEQVASVQNPACNSQLLADYGITWQFIFFNNVKSVLIGSGLGFISMGIGGLLLLMAAIAPIGGLGNIMVQSGANIFLLFIGFILPHGIIELPAAIMATGAALQVATCFIAPPNGMSIGRNLQFSLINYVKLMALIIPLLFIAALIEGNLTPIIGCWITNSRF